MEDLRQRRTKKFLMRALLELMEERPFREVSVVDICERAMVHRTTFYAHFEDKNALLRYTLTHLQREFETAEGDEGDFPSKRAYFLAMFQRALKFVRTHKKLYLSGVTGDGTELRMLEELVAGELAGKLSGTVQQPVIAAHFYAGGILALIRWWLENDMPVTDEALLGEVGRFIPPEGAQQEAHSHG